MNYNEMTAAQCADWLAERDGWRIYREQRTRPAYLAPGLRLVDPTTPDHPYPLTLDGAAGALREPWYLVRVSHYGVRLACHIERMNPACERMVVDAPDRMTAEYRAAVAARMEEER